MLKNRYKEKKTLILNLAILFTLFLTSVLIRTDNLKAPMGRHHEWLTGHVLSTVSIFEKNGAANHHFSPVFIFNSKADRFLVSWQSFKDENNYAYYTSYPPFCFLFPYFIFKLTGITSSVLGIRIIGLIIHFLSALLIYLLLLKLFKKSILTSIFIPAFISYSLYLFASGNLWFHANIFFADTLVQPFVIGMIYLFVFILEDPEKSKFKKIILLFVLVFFGVYTEYLALFTAFFIFSLLAFHIKKLKLFWPYLATISIATIFSLGLSIWQYSSIAGFDEFKAHNIEKYKQRSGHDATKSEENFSFQNQEAHKRILDHYELNYNHIIAFFAVTIVLFLILMIIKLLNRSFQFNRIHLFVFLIIIFSIATHHLSFFNFTAVHDFSTLKSSIFFTLFVGYTLSLLLAFFKTTTLKNMMAILFITVTIYYIDLSIKKYYKVNSHEISYLYQKITGDLIKKYSHPDEIVFMNGFSTPVIWYYAQRNMTEAINADQSIAFLKQCNYDKGVFINVLLIDGKWRIEKYKVFSNGETRLLN